MGVSGCGKSTVAGLLAAHLGWDLVEGDDLHPPANVAKMRSGVPLTDADRIPWLRRIAAWIAEHVESERDGVVTCSALRRAYRDVLRDDHVVFVHLDGTRDHLLARLAGRHGHFMPVALLDSQLSTLEPPGPDEQAIRIDISSGPAEQADRIVEELDS